MPFSQALMSSTPEAVLARREIRATNSAKRKELADLLRLEAGFRSCFKSLHLQQPSDLGQ